MSEQWLFWKALTETMREQRVADAAETILDALYNEYTDANEPRDLPRWYFEMIDELEQMLFVELDERVLRGHPHPAILAMRGS